MAGDVTPGGTTGARVAADPGAMADEVLRLLSAYDGAGIATREWVEDAPPEFHPSRVMPGFESIIVIAREPRDVPRQDVPGKFHRTLAMIAAQDAVVRYLSGLGYRTQLIGSRSTAVSLPRLGERAGVGELSPVRTLAVSGHGLRTVLAAIITDAPLRQSPPATGACPNREACISQCPALGADGTFDRSRCSSCGRCVRTCPVVGAGG